MSYLGRTISRDKWDAHPEFAPDQVPADLLTREKELKTTNNTLSFWESTVSGEEAMLCAALAHASNSNLADVVHVAWIDGRQLEQDDIELQRSPGVTPIADLRQAHIDAARLDADRLARLAKRLATAIRQPVGPQVKVLTRAELLELMQAAIDTGRVGYANLKQDLRAQLRPRS